MLATFPSDPSITMQPTANVDPGPWNILLSSLIGFSIRCEDARASHMHTKSTARDRAAGFAGERGFSSTYSHPLPVCLVDRCESFAFSSPPLDQITEIPIWHLSSKFLFNGSPAYQVYQDHQPAVNPRTSSRVSKGRINSSSLLIWHMPFMATTVPGTPPPALLASCLGVRTV